MNSNSQANHALRSNNATWTYSGNLNLNNTKRSSKYFIFIFLSYTPNNPMKYKLLFSS